MNNNFLRRYRKKLFGKILLIIGLCLIGLLLCLFLADGIFNDLLANLVHRLSPELYRFFVSYKMELVFVAFAGITVLVVYFTISKSTEYMDVLVQSINKVFRKDESLVMLPRDFKEIENTLNSIKFDALKNEQLAKEAEQRKNDLVVYLAHDLKTPLTSVIGYLSLLNEEGQISPQLQKRYLSIALEKAERLEDLINEFFEITRFNLQNITLQVTRFNLSMLLEQLADEFYPLLSQKKLTCRIHVPADLMVYGDSDKLARVFDNVLRNAINYSYENTPIDIEAAVNGQGVRIVFRNQGPQIPEHKLGSIFEKFYRLDSSRSTKTGGAGLGLAIAKEIIELHKGTIAAKSSAQATEFYLYLPFGGPSFPTSQSSPALSLPPKRV